LWGVSPRCTCLSTYRRKLISWITRTCFNKSKNRLQ
jgi:hypothetical protein